MQHINVTKRFPFTPFPIGWFYIGFSDQLPKGKLLSKMWMGRKIVTWRNKEDNICVADATCPHLGACLAPELGGRLDNDVLVCPFHGFRYNSNGSCVDTRSDPLKKVLSLRTYPVLEIHGVIFAFWHPEGKEPTWQIPDLEQDRKVGQRSSVSPPLLALTRKRHQKTAYTSHILLACTTIVKSSVVGRSCSMVHWFETNSH